jgi:hypothetical protein
MKRSLIATVFQSKAMVKLHKGPRVTPELEATRTLDGLSLLSLWAVEANERTIAHTAAAKELGAMHTRLMTPQLILSALTSTCTAHNLQGGDHASILAVFTAVIAIVCTVLNAITNFVEFNIVAEKHAVTARRYDAMHRHLSSLPITGHDVKLEIEMAALEFKHISDIAPVM